MRLAGKRAGMRLADLPSYEVLRSALLLYFIALVAALLFGMPVLGWSDGPVMVGFGLAAAILVGLFVLRFVAARSRARAWIATMRELGFEPQPASVRNWRSLVGLRTYETTLRDGTRVTATHQYDENDVECALLAARAPAGEEMMMLHTLGSTADLQRAIDEVARASRKGLPEPSRAQAREPDREDDAPARAGRRRLAITIVGVAVLVGLEVARRMRWLGAWGDQWLLLVILAVAAADIMLYIGFETAARRRARRGPGAGNA